MDYSYKDTITTSARCLLAILFVTAVIGSSSFASPYMPSSARSAAMGGAYTALAKGVDAVKFNPANLGLTDYRTFGFEFASIGASITNNSFTLSDYNKYTGATLTTSDKEDILAKVPNEGLSLDADVRASAVSVAFGNMSISLSGVGAADINLNKDILDLLLNGNTFADTIEVTGSYSDGISYARLDFSYGMPIYSSATRQLAIGASLGYIRGIAVEQLVELEGLGTTLVTGFEAEGKAIIRTATGGSGYALDAGAALKLSDDYTVGVRFENLLSNISWGHNAEEHGYVFEFDTTTVDNMDDDFVVSDDYTKEIDAFSTSLPSVMNIGFANTSGKFLWAVDWNQGFRNAPGSSTKPRLSFGGEYQLLSMVPLRAGYSVGGDRGSALSFGSGLKFMGFYLDAAVLTGTSGSVYSAKGANFALSTGLQF